MRASPKGSIFQHWPTANPRRMMAGGGILSISTLDTTQSFRLNNRDKTGNFIIVWHCDVDFEPKASWTTNEVNAFTAYGPDNGLDSPDPAFPLSGGFSLNPGVTQTVLNDPFVDTYPTTILAHPGQWSWQHDWPLFYLQPGQYFGIAISAVPSASFGSVAINFYWETGVPKV